ncbi:MAG: NifU family protein [Bacteroidetes bacterium]|nr:MAG: NifU family protein [Bacteroidota bacterium]
MSYNTDQLYKTQLHIYTEAVPNPNSLKFVFNAMLMNPDAQGKDYPCAETAEDSPLAQEIFKFEFVERVFIAKNFITISKNNLADWHEIQEIMRHFLTNYIEEGSKVFANTAEEEAIIANDSPAVRQIKEILEEYIRPAVEGDGGAINFHSFDTEAGVLKVQLQGSCSGCPSSSITLKAGIENLFKRMMPQVKEVVAEGV